MRTLFNKILVERAKKDKRIFMILADIGYGEIEPFRDAFPGRWYNCGVAEQNMTGVACGVAMEGNIAITYSIANFPTLRCLEQIRNDICYHCADVKIVCVGGGMSYGAVGFSHHATEDLAILRALPNMMVLSPGDLWEAAEASRFLAGHSGPAYLRLDKSTAPATHRPHETFHPGKIRTVRDGSDIALAATGGILGEALLAADFLAGAGISCRVLSVHTVKPLDADALTAAALETGGIVSIEEHAVEGGLGGAIAETLMEAGIFPRFFIRMGLRNTFSSVVGSQQYLRKVYSLDAPSIVRAVSAKLGVALPALA
jgi:transketolase